MVLLNLMMSGKGGGDTSTPPTSQGLNYTGNYSIISGAASSLSVDSFEYFQFNDSCLYYNGNTYFVTKRNQNSSDGRAIIFKYDGNNITSSIMPESSQGTDYHNYATIVIDDSGYIYIIHAAHNALPTIFKSDQPDDITSFTKLIHNMVSTHSYARIYYVSGVGFIQISRAFNTYILLYTKSVDMVIWDQPKTLTQLTDEGVSTDTRHYPVGIMNAKQGDFIHFMFLKQMTVGGSRVYTREYKMKTPTNPVTCGRVWYNEQETFNKDVFSSGTLTETELDTNFLVWVDSTNTNVARSEGGIIHAGKYYSNTNRSDLPNRVIYHYDGGWNEVISDAHYLMNSSDGLYSLDDRRNREKGIHKISDDLSIMVSKSIPFFQNPAGIRFYRAPMNMDDIPIGQKFLIVGSDATNGNDIISGAYNNDIIAWECIKS